ncbi:hypothetical protein P8452_70003 [Trifolium repens]|nr:hypothetical protein P8452_70003 [Trifolium repens]
MRSIGGEIFVEAVGSEILVDAVYSEMQGIEKVLFREVGKAEEVCGGAEFRQLFGECVVSRVFRESGCVGRA